MKRATPRVGRARLLRLADYLEKTVAPQLNGLKFDMGCWGEWETKKDEPPRSIQEAKECGFAGCAVGHAILAPALFPGLRRAVETSGCDVSISVDDVAEYFGLDGEDAMMVFLPGAYRSPDGDRRADIPLSAVVTRIRQVAAEMGG